MNGTNSRGAPQGEDNNIMDDNDSRRTVTICPNCQTIRYGHPKYCINCGNNLMGAKIAQLPDPDETGWICPRCHAFAPASAKYCSECGSGLRTPYNRPAEDELITKTYNRMNQESANKMFYGSVDEASKILDSLRRALFGDTVATEKQFEESAFFYTQVWLRKHGGA